MKFTKMHGLGNDYVYVNCFEETVDDPVALAPIISDRHMGVGSDGLILIMPSESADARMRIFNADGSEAEMCGNGLRCVAKYVLEHHLATSRGPLSLPDADTCCNASLCLETGNGLLTVGLQTDISGMVESVCVNMGQPKLSPAEIPARVSGDRMIESPIILSKGEFKLTCVSMGNPHAVVFTENVDMIDLADLGGQIENHPLFPNRTNVHFVEVTSPKLLKVRTWERGSGVTLACGTGACACGVAGVLTERAARECVTDLPGGPLTINWHTTDNCVYMTGPATEVFTGEW